MRISIHFALSLLFFAKSAFPQPAPHELKIGDQCPNFVLDHLINSASKTVHLADFRGKLVILDFFATWCGPCLDALPKLDSLQRKFKNDLVVLPVSYQQTGYVHNFLVRNPHFNFHDLVYLTADTLLRRYFPYRLIPHEVWIDANGKVAAFTGSEEVTADNLNIYFKKGLKNQLKVKKDILHIDASKPLLAGEFGDDYHVNADRIAYQSLFLRGYIDGAGSGVNTSKTGDCNKRLFRNMTITNLYRFGVFSRRSDSSGHVDPYIFYQPSRVILDVKDSTLFDWPGLSGEQWRKKPQDSVCFTYEQYTPLEDSANADSYMLQDLNRYFGALLKIDALIGKRNVQCWQLVRLSNKTALMSDSTGLAEGVKIDLSNFIGYLMFLRQHEPVPIIAQTCFLHPEKFFLKTPDWKQVDLRDLTHLNSFLHDYGLSFKLTRQDIDMIVIQDKKK